MTRDAVDRILDVLGMAAAGVVVAKEAGAPLPSWLAIAGGVVAYALGKAARPGVPMRATKTETKGEP